MALESLFSKKEKRMPALQYLQPAITVLAALGCAVMAGVFFAFSSFVMKALARLPVHHAIAAMQAINIAVLRSVFLVVFLGNTLLCAALVVWSLLQWSAPGAAWACAGGLVYVLGAFVVTVARNVPLNNALALAVPTAAHNAKTWEQFYSPWMVWNHVRCLASLLAAALLVVALLA
jgi:uncharacterized membrane protein